MPENGKSPVDPPFFCCTTLWKFANDDPEERKQRNERDFIMATQPRAAFGAAVLASLGIGYLAGHAHGSGPDTGTTRANCPETGDVCADGTIFAGNNFSVTAADAPSLYRWTSAKHYCENLETNGHDDWTLPTGGQLDQLYQKKDTGAFAGTFNDTVVPNYYAHWYWSSKEPGSNSSNAWSQRFTDGGGGWSLKVGDELSVRCVRAEPVAP
jgi:hypothetical protein